MDMTLSVIRYNNAPPQHAMSFIVGEGGCKIGRSAQNDLALPDPDLWVSGYHAAIQYRNGHFFLVDNSRNGTFLNNASERVPPGQEVQLNDGDGLTIGAYEIGVSISRPEESATDVFAPFGRREPPPDATDPFDPFDQQRPIGGQFDQQAGPQGGHSGLDLLHRPATEPEATERLPEGQEAPDILDLIGSVDGKDQDVAEGLWEVSKPNPPSLHTAPPGNDASFLSHSPSELASEGPGVESEQRVARTEGSSPDHTPQEHAFFHVPEVIPEDYDLLGANPKAPDESTSAGQVLPPIKKADPAPGLASEESLERTDDRSAASETSASVPAKPISTPPPLPPSAFPQAPLTPAPNDEDPVTAFLAGLGYNEASPAPEDVFRLMQTSGALLRVMIEGLMAVMRSRASFKSELRIEMTMIRSVENNPFKFSASADDALSSLLFRRTKGFLPPIQAAKETLDDIQAHEMAMIAGLRAAIRAVLARLDPNEIEHRFRKDSVVDSLLPMAKKAKCWDRFADIYADIAADTADDFLNLFGDVFTRAYEEQARQLKESRHRTAN